MQEKYSRVVRLLLHFKPSICRRVYAFSILLFLSHWTIPSVALGSTGPVSLIAQDAAQLMPRSFRSLLPKYFSNLEAGIDKFSCQPYLSGHGRLALEQELVTKLAGTVKLLNSKPKFSTVMEELGSVAEMVLLLNLPELPEPTRENLLSLKIGLEINSPSFPRVVYDPSELSLDLNSVKQLLQEISTRRVFITRRYREFFFDESPIDLTIPLDPKSPPFGVLSLVYSHTVNDLARVWLWIWRAANGDMAGRPYFAGAGSK